MLGVLTAGSLPQAFFGLKLVRLEVRRPDLRFAVTDLSVPKTNHKRPMLDDETAAKATPQFDVLNTNPRESGITLMIDPFSKEK
jgi:hypothetical protein